MRGRRRLERVRVLAMRVVSLVALVLVVFVDAFAVACAGLVAAGSDVATRLAVERDERVWRRGFAVALGARVATGAVVAFGLGVGAGVAAGLRPVALALAARASFVACWAFAGSSVGLAEVAVFFDSLNLANNIRPASV